MALEALVAGVMFAALAAYAVLAGADFGGGVWDLVSRGPRASAQRKTIADAIGPVWEANHVWLIFFIVLLFTCFPRAYAAASVALFWPLHLVLIGIVLRGSSFVFRAYGPPGVTAEAVWGRVFGAASAVSPVLLGMCLGTLSSGGIQFAGGQVAPSSQSAWLSPFPLVVGLLALALCAYLAAVYLVMESAGALAEDFRRRALAAWIVAGIVSVATLAVAAREAPHLWRNLSSWPALGLLIFGALLAPASLAALWRGHFRWARALGAGQVITLLAGWAAAQWPYLIYPGLTIQQAVAPHSTLAFTAGTLPFGLALLVPALWFLFSVFKGRTPHTPVE
ncbi:MAG: cytochrome d ubiquinol oxidase subunit II [Acidobacteriota bacterium]